ncbi:RPII140-upstream gene protein [Sergentomyia squamirostris]
MLRNSRNGIPLLGFIPMVFEKKDEVSTDVKTSKDFLTRQIEEETGRDRLKKMFTIGTEEGISPELVNIQHSGFLGIFIGCCYGGFLSSRKAYVDFMENNQATAFSNHLDAKKKLQHSITMSFGKGAWRWGWRLGLFTTSYVGISTIIAVYRGKSSIFEYMAGGLAAGAMYKMNLGLRGMVAGGLVGCAVGTVGGALSLSLLKASGMTMEEMRYWQYRWKLDRQNTINKSIRYSTEKPDPLLEAHEQRLEEKSIDLSEVEQTASKK